MKRDVNVKYVYKNAFIFSWEYMSIILIPQRNEYYGSTQSFGYSYACYTAGIDYYTNAMDYIGEKYIHE